MTALMYALLIIIATAAAVAITIHFSVIGTKEVATHRAEGIANKAKNDLETFLNAAVNTAIGWQYSFTKGIRPLPTDIESQNPLWYNDYWDTFAAALRGSIYNLRTAGIIFADGNRVFCSSSIDEWRNRTLQREQFMCRLVTWRKGYESNPNMTGNELILTLNRFDYSTINKSFNTVRVDPRTTSSYTLVPHTPGANLWRKLRLDLRQSLSVIGVSSTVFNETGTMLGVITITIPLNIGKFVDAIVTTENSVLILIDNEDLLLGSSYYIPHMKRNWLYGPYNGTLTSNCLVTKTAHVCRESLTSYPYPPLNELQSSHPEIIDGGTRGGFLITKVCVLSTVRRDATFPLASFPLGAVMEVLPDLHYINIRHCELSFPLHHRVV